MDWIDDFLDNKCNLIQISIIENLLNTSSVAYKYDNLEFEHLDFDEANSIIEDLKENDNPKDCREQWKRHTK